MGLSTSHISPPAVHVSAGGSVVRLSGYRVGLPGDPTKTRGAVYEFSERSRRRLLYLLGEIPRDRLADALFVTLTYPGEWSDDPSEWKRHLDVFCKRIERRFPGAAIIWRLEFQRRGAPHYHLIVVGCRWIPHDLVRRYWYETVGSGDDRHLAAGTRVERVKSWKHLLSYAAKYAAKVDPHAASNPSLVGRHWGQRRRRQLAIVRLSRTVDRSTFYRLRRVLRGLARARGWRWRGKPAGRGAWIYATADTQAKLLWLAPPCLAPGGLDRT